VRELAAIVVILAALASSIAWSADDPNEIDVSANADAKAAQQQLAEIGSTLLPCLIEASGNGRADADAEAYCFCRKRSFVESHLSRLTSLWQQHPEWKGKTLKIVSGSEGDRETHRFGKQQIDEIEAGLKGAAKSCE